MTEKHLNVYIWEWENSENAWRCVIVRMVCSSHSLSLSHSHTSAIHSFFRSCNEHMQYENIELSMTVHVFHILFYHFNFVVSIFAFYWCFLFRFTHKWKFTQISIIKCTNRFPSWLFAPYKFSFVHSHEAIVWSFLDMFSFSISVWWELVNKLSMNCVKEQCKIPAKSFFFFQMQTSRFVLEIMKLGFLQNKMKRKSSK